jgi:uncharacterized protein
MQQGEIIIGVISDTHGLLRPQAINALRGCHMIIHAGDVGDPGIIDGLRDIAPSSIVRGNIDKGQWALRLPTRELVTVGRHRFLLLHEISALDLDPAAAGLAAVVFGHSHRAVIEARNEVLFINPGSAGPRRFNLPVSVARISVSEQRICPQIVNLPVT